MLLAIAVLVGAGTVRAYTLRDLLREQEGAHLRHDAELVGALVADRVATGRPVDQEFLADLVSPLTRLTYEDPQAGRRSSAAAPTAAPATRARHLPPA